MALNLSTLYSRTQSLLSREDGQDLVEYALVVALIALGATTAMGTLATDIAAIFGTISTALMAA